MGSIVKSLNPANMFSGGGTDIYNNLNESGLFGPANQFLSMSDEGRMALDPLDLFGGRAQETQDEMSRISKQSAYDSLQAQDEMRQIIKEYLEPYATASENALGDFTAMATGGEVNNALSPQYQWQRGQGLKNMRRGLSAMGRRMSTFGGEQTANFLNQLGLEEANRQYGTSLDTIKAGLGAVGSLGSATQNQANVAGQTYGNLGNVLNAAQQNYGANRANSLYQAGNALSGLGNYLAYTNR